MTAKLEKTDAEWRQQLTPEQYHILREKGTERPFTGVLTNNHDDGMYHCGACDAPLFTSETKFDSGCGWPSFYAPISSDAITSHEDNSYGMRRVEVTCARCGAANADAARFCTRCGTPLGGQPGEANGDGRTVFGGSWFALKGSGQPAG